MNHLTTYFAGFTSCTEGELGTARSLQISLNIAAFTAIFFAVRKLLTIKNPLARSTLVIITPIFIYAAFVIIYVVLTLSMTGACSGSPGLWQF